MAIPRDRGDERRFEIRQIRVGTLVIEEIRRQSRVVIRSSQGISAVILSEICFALAKEPTRSIFASQGLASSRNPFSAPIR
jgi:hypothetical protein